MNCEQFHKEPEYTLANSTNTTSDKFQHTTNFKLYTYNTVTSLSNSHTVPGQRTVDLTIITCISTDHRLQPLHIHHFHHNTLLLQTSHIKHSWPKKLYMQSRASFQMPTFLQWDWHNTIGICHCRQYVQSRKNWYAHQVLQHTDTYNITPTHYCHYAH